MFVEHKEVGEEIHAPAKVLKLSEALRLGAKIRPQSTHGGFLDGRSCAIVAAAEGAGLDVVGHPSKFRITEAAWGYLFERGIVDQRYDGSVLSGEILDRNDRQTREQIADWLEQQGL
jgi:hypothetical protein